MAAETALHLSRRQYQRQLERRRRRIRRRRRSRIHRVRFLRSIQTTRFWSRVLVLLGFGLAFAFWAKFAYVYDIPSSANQSTLNHVQSYVTIKNWWFGPTLFDLGAYQSYPIPDFASNNSYLILLDNLGHYRSVVEQPQFIWIQR